MAPLELGYNYEHSLHAHKSLAKLSPEKIRDSRLKVTQKLMEKGNK